MTTIVGLQGVYQGKPVVVLASDTTITSERTENHGEITRRIKDQGLCKKMYPTLDGKGIVAIAGDLNDLTTRLLQKLVRGEVDIQYVCAEKKFPEFLEATLAQTGGKTMQPGKETFFLLAYPDTNGSPQLYSCWPLGCVEQVRRTSVGSGSDHAIAFINRELTYGRQPRLNFLDREESPNVQDCIKLASGGVRCAARDMYTNGLDVSVVTPDGVKSYGERIRKTLELAEQETIHGICEEFPL